MRSRDAVTVAIIVLAVVAIAAVALHDDGPEWRISYDTGGGVLPDWAPSGYDTGDVMELPEPELDGFVFMGWYLDEGFTEPMESIDADTTGDLVLHARWIPYEEHSVVYVLDGGVLEDGQDTFVGGMGMSLPYPQRDGYRFAGWFEDPGFEVPIVVIGREVLDDITVYACWDDEGLTGTGYVWDVEGVYYNGDIRHTMTGIVTTEYIAERGGAFYYQTQNDLLYQWPDGSTTDGSLTGSWTDSTGSGEMTYVGIGEAGGVMCTIWETEDGELVWLHHLFVQMRISLKEGTTDITYTLSDEYSFTPDDRFMPQVSAEYPLKVSGVSVARIGDSLTFTASGEGFTGWYSGGRLLTEERTLIVGRADPMGSYEARAGDGYQVVEQGTSSLEGFGFGQGTEILDSDGAPVTSDVADLGIGYYTAVLTVGNVRTYMEFLVDAHRDLGMTWTFDGRTYSVTYGIDYSDVYMYTYTDPYGNIRISLSDPDYIANYHTVDDPVLRDIASQLMALGSGMGRADLARFVLSFAQSVPYVDDTASAGTGEYWKYPLETLWDGGGDCEDKTILCDTLLMICGYDVAFILFTDHAMSAVAVDADGNSVVSDEGVRYYLCETTNGWDIGVTSVGHRVSDIYYWCPVTVDGHL